MPYCTKCGREVGENDRFCPSCGLELSVLIVQEPVQAPRIPEQVNQRPTGVTVLAALEILSGLLLLGVGALMFAVVGSLGAMVYSPYVPEFPAFLSGLGLSVIGVIMVIIGIIGFILAYGYLNGLGWSWTLGLILGIISIIIDLMFLPTGAIGILINTIILYYLTRPNVKRFFGKEPIPFSI